MCFQPGCNYWQILKSGLSQGQNAAVGNYPASLPAGPDPGRCASACIQLLAAVLAQGHSHKVTISQAGIQEHERGVGFTAKGSRAGEGK